MDTEITRIYGNRFRTRVLGLCWKNEELLMVRHAGLTNGDFWSPPGGGMEFGKTAPVKLIEEFNEETGVCIEPLRFLFACEFNKPPLHALELFFEVSFKSGEIKKGFDPEMAPDKQIIKEVRWMPFDEIQRMPSENKHGILSLFQKPADLRALTGYWQI